MSEYDYTGNKTKNSFTAYLQKFVRRKRQDYIDRKNYLCKMETSFEKNTCINVGVTLDGYLDQYYQKWDEYYQQWDDFEEDPKQEEPERLTFSNLKSFQADTIDGDKFSQDDIAKKDVTVINFWSMMCGYCIDELPEIAKYADTLPDNVQVITVCLDLEGDDEVKAAQNTLKDAGFKGTTLIKGDGDFKTVCEEIQYTPTTIFVDKEGNTIGNAITAAIDSEMDSEKLADIYTGSVNEVLKSMGKPEIK